MSVESALAGKKRKRYTPVEKDASVKLTGKLHHSLKEVHKAVKKAKTFETQRLVKKLKDLRKPMRNPEKTKKEIQDLETQLEALKRIDQNHVAHIVLSSKVRKDKFLSSNQALVSVITSMAPAFTKQDALHAKVENRLLSSKFLSAEVGLVVDGLRTFLDPGSKVKSEGDGGGAKNLIEPDIIGEKRSDRKRRAGDEANTELKFISSSEASAREEDPGKSPELDEVVDEVDDMVDDGGWESGSIDDADPEDSHEQDADESPGPPSKRSKHLSSPGPKLLPSDHGKAKAASTFLPSLSVGFIKGDSDSDFEESEELVPDAGRKNRRGQRARQAIWEKKYGRNAKHVKKRQEDVEAAVTARKLGKNMDSGWGGRSDPNLPKADQSRGKTYRPSNPSVGEGRGIVTAEKPTHPSWEAKKKLKEKESAKILPSQGKKIVFT